MPDISVNLLLKVLPSGLTIAFLAGVESLLSATVVDGMSGDNHNSNAELVAEGAANIFCMFFAGVPATGAIARTAANFKARAYSPVSGIMQSVFLLLFTELRRLYDKNVLTFLPQSVINGHLKQLETIARALDMRIDDLYESEYK